MKGPCSMGGGKEGGASGGRHEQSADSALGFPPDIENKEDER